MTLLLIKQFLFTLNSENWVLILLESELSWDLVMDCWLQLAVHIDLLRLRHVLKISLVDWETTRSRRSLSH